MDYGVYLESSIVDLKPRILDFLTKLVEKAKEAKEYAVAFKKKELAELTGKGVRTTARYLHELEERKIITTKGVRGRSGGTVILFNPELIRFETSDKAFINSDDPVSIDDIVEQKLPKKQKEPKEKKRNRRTKQQMIEARALENQKQLEINRLNDKVIELGGVPNWEWFQLTDDPVGNYRTYLISRLYNRYAVLFADRHNAEVSLKLVDGYPVKRVSDDYDVLPKRFYGSSRWYQFEKFRKFCEENDINPAVYLSAQFNRSVYSSSREANNENKKKNKCLPFVNALISDSSYEVYRQYCELKKQHSLLYLSVKKVPALFMHDFVVRAIVEAYESADTGKGLWQYRSAIEDFLRGVGAGSKEDALIRFYELTSKNLRSQGVSFKTRDSIKKFVLLQSIIQISGRSLIPNYVFLGSEMIQVMLASIEKAVNDKKQARELKKFSLGRLMYPHLSEEDQKEKGGDILYQMEVLYETPKVLQLIMERKGLRLSLADLNEAFREYGKEKVPVDDYSMLDIDKVIDFVGLNTELEESIINYDDPALKRGWELVGTPSKPPLEDFIEEALNKGII